ncbi:MAG TPA: hypothetical protein VMR49_00470 [Candidatus Paceibacterota bacterium]|jgi:hypothetical protein|nr:hypothetical protein [Candidatus Paceibacterota bacterium]
MSKAKEITTYIAKNESTQRILFRVLVSSLSFLFCIYIYLIGSITFNVLASKSLTNTISALSHNVNQLELEYLDSSDKIDKNYALSKGFVDANNNLFATRATPRVAIR